ncbi:uncharacterized protein LOC117172074 [Belonocnema kinseyi]|uniref:uncharacterized protein LOC117172074 n=1 Tax=Belonocnema kinseyi TaxID=2817044 RepID=UPI00143CD735|nr:uncharacterized protein LOC117172074 [Belonocnema kinseyi]
MELDTNVEEMLAALLDKEERIFQDCENTIQDIVKVQAGAGQQEPSLYESSQHSESLRVPHTNNGTSQVAGPSRDPDISATFSLDDAQVEQFGLFGDDGENNFFDPCTQKHQPNLPTLTDLSDYFHGGDQPYTLQLSDISVDLIKN